MLDAEGRGVKGYRRPLSHVPDDSCWLSLICASVFSLFLPWIPSGTAREVPFPIYCAARTRRDGHTRKPETDLDALNFWMAQAERTLTCLWGHWLRLCTVLSLSLSLSLALFHSLTQSCPLSLSLLPVLASAPAVGGAGFPGIVGQLFLLCFATSCSISFALMTALLQDYTGAAKTDSCYPDTLLPTSMQGFTASASVVINIFSWFRSEVFLQQKCLGCAKWGEIHRWVK